MKKIVGSHIRSVRKGAGYKTVESFAEALDVHPNSVGELERGTNWISSEMLSKMSAKLNLPPAAFFPGPRDTPEEALRTLMFAVSRMRRLEDDVKLTQVAQWGLGSAKRSIVESLATLNEDEARDLLANINAQLGPRSGKPASSDLGKLPKKS